MARLIGEAARAWLAQNPNASYTDNISGQTIARQKSGIEKLLAGITQPFRGGAGVAQEFGLTLADIIRMAQGKDTVKRPDKYALLSQEESETLKKDPLKFGLKSGAGVASYGLGGVSKAPAAITALGRIGQAAGKGALAGTAGGFAYSDEGEELSDTLKGGALGGLLGGALQGVGEGVRAIKGAKLPKTSEFGLETRGKAIGLDANKLATSNKTSVTSSTQGKQVIRDYFDDMDTLGLPTHTSEIASTSSDKALAKYGDEFKGLLGSADSVKTFTVKDTNKIISNIEKGFINRTCFGILQAARTRISKTEYIACPSCGRTLFDLVEVTNKIRKRTEHLKGVKIAIMGCIVNGPGEMADADFGYVGSGLNKITLYHGKEIVRRNVNSDNAVDELIEIIREKGSWIEPVKI